MDLGSLKMLDPDEIASRADAGEYVPEQVSAGERERVRAVLEGWCEQQLHTVATIRAQLRAPDPEVAIATFFSRAALDSVHAATTLHAELLDKPRLGACGAAAIQDAERVAVAARRGGTVGRAALLAQLPPDRFARALLSLFQRCVLTSPTLDPPARTAAPSLDELAASPLRRSRTATATSPTARFPSD